MAKRKEQTFDADGLKALRAKLERHAKDLAHKLRTCDPLPTFKAACELRDAAQFLVTTLMTVRIITETSLPLAELSAEPESVPHLGECGLSE